MTIIKDIFCGLVVRVSGYRSKVRVRFPALPHLLRSSGSATGCTKPRENNEELLERKSCGSGLGNREYGRRDPSRCGTLYPKSVQ
jgi:hypothetical protein